MDKKFRAIFGDITFIGSMCRIYSVCGYIDRDTLKELIADCDELCGNVDRYVILGEYKGLIIWHCSHKIDLLCLNNPQPKN